MEITAPDGIKKCIATSSQVIGLVCINFKIINKCRKHIATSQDII
jgi:hypothetical protein